MGECKLAGRLIRLDIVIMRMGKDRKAKRGGIRRGNLERLWNKKKMVEGECTSA